MKTKGFTLIELMIVIVIIGVMAVFVIPYALKDANGAERFIPQLATNENIDSVVTIMKNDAGLKVNLMTHLANWTNDGADIHLDQAQVVESELRSKGITKDRIIPHYSNKDGLVSKTDPVIPADGVYLLLTR